MKKFLLLVMASMMTIGMMAVEGGDGSTKAQAIEFDWDNGNVHMGGTKWYHVDLAPLYEEDSPSLLLNIANPSPDKSVATSMTATIAGSEQTRKHTIAPRAHQTYTEEASALVFMGQKEIYLTLTTDGEVHLRAKVYETADLDDACEKAKELKWNVEATQAKGYDAWWKVDVRDIKNTAKYPTKDAKVTITNAGSGPVNLKVGQSLDCPSSGLTKREFTLAAGASFEEVIPQSMITSVYPDEIYFTVDNPEQPVKMKVEMVERSSIEIIPASASFTDLHVTDTIKPLPTGKTYYRIKVSEMNSKAKYEPEFTYRNESASKAKVTVKMAFDVPAFTTVNSVYDLAAGEEEIVVYKKNMLDGIQGVEYIYLLTEVEGDVNFYGRFKHVREGKACKTNIDFEWGDKGHNQEARSTQWYAVRIADARDSFQDIELHVKNLGSEAAKLDAKLAFACPYIDLQEISRSIAADKEEVRTIRYSTYGLINSDTVWVGLETSQDIKFWAITKPTETKTPDKACEAAIDFDWAKGIEQDKDVVVWYKVSKDSVEKLFKDSPYPTIFVQNLSSADAKITAELSLECPDIYENQQRSLTVPGDGAYTKQISRDLFEHISSDEVYLRVVTTEKIFVQVRFNKEAAGSSCASAIPFNWVSGNTQAANANLWYSIDAADIQSIIKENKDIKAHLLNRDNAECTGFVQLAFDCPADEITSIRNFKLGAGAEKSITIENSAIESMVSGTVYFNVQGSTALRFWAEKLDPAPFTPITGEGITLKEIAWDKTYTQTEDTAWYVLPKSQIEYVRDLKKKDTPVTAVAHLIDASSSAKTISAEGAFAFPIVKKMMGKSQKLNADQHISEKVPAGTFDQAIQNHDSVILRVIRTKGSGAFQFKAELVKAFSGNTPMEAIPVRMNALYTQGANTELWYKVNTAALKSDKTLFNKSLHVMGKNAGVGKTTVTAAVYDGYKASYDKKDDLLMGRGKKTIKKGLTKSHNVPAQAIYGVGDVELYIKLHTTDSLVFESKFAGEYAPLSKDSAKAVAAAQKKAKLVVPNVEYTLKGDNKEHWYQICVPYIQNNYKYVDNLLDSTYLEYELDSTVTIEGTATFQDAMDCQMPVRKRTINKANKVYKGQQSLRALANKAIKRAGYSFDVSGTDPELIDSLLHRFATKDSITLYVRLKADHDIKARLFTKQLHGDDCNNAMSFDWEHGNVNPKDSNNWYVVALDTVQMYAEGKSLRLHVDNWSEDKDNDVSASIFFQCGGAKQGSASKTIAANDSLTKDIALDYIKTAKTKLIFIDFKSTQDAHVWIEKVDVKRDTVYGGDTLFVCKGATAYGHVINADTVWSDTIRDLKNEKELALYDSISHVEIFVRREQQNYDFSALLNIKRDAVLDLTAADTWVKAQYAAAEAANDTLEKVTGIKWQYAIYNDPTFIDIDLTNQPTLSAERINVQYVATTECSSTIEELFKNSVSHTLVIDTCSFYRWAANDSLYLASTTDSIVFPGGAAWGDSTSYLKLTVGNPAKFDLAAESKFGNRILVLNRIQINKTAGWENSLDSIYDPAKADVKWYQMLGATPNPSSDKYLGPGYYFNEADGRPMSGDFYAEIRLASASGTCPLVGRTIILHCASAAGLAPVLAPSIAMPGEDIKVLNLDPEKETLIRIYTTEGLLQHTYNVSGQETFTIKAANDHGFYLVELLSGEDKSTLRYIVK